MNMETIKDFNRNEKQQFFSGIRGILKEFNQGEKFSNITLEVGHERVRPVNLVIKNANLDAIKEHLILGEKLSVTYYITSRKVENKWTTMANVLSVKSDKDFQKA